ncbi:ATP-dependent helicase HrpB [Sphingomicrobium astaxanthinifaciens]|uniref:ATP-dependent helicase HrpB n=1 Tax=Sphingomicrobium astaxanthinifaciens TaxID=1227949 RepID=UPI001FCA73DB|nr:ATP-dependent helicase HrpB [Sphingomicrobium astaxanthinifaciens]MCJ7420738.1 ATP-dependent helicase HrpB [Sphingomicrobium astaxanthinifaciens]
MLPIHAVLPDLLAALAAQPRALLVAPPGAGKTTHVAPALLEADWCTGEVLLLVPRRLAARAAAERIAEEAGEKPGERFGYATRLDSRPGRRVTLMTHGVFLARIQSDPELRGVSAVLFDEVHERSLDNDLALAFALEAQAGLREDLRLLLMSATLEVEAFRPLLGDAPLIESEGRSHPLELRHVGRDAAAPIEAEMARTIRRALAAEEGSLLAFLPGVREIERTAAALGALPGDVVLHRLHGQVDPAAQRAALRAPARGTRKLVLASAIAETSVTVDDVRIVVDAGLARRPRYDVGAGLTRLVTERASRAAVTQRAGRAARQRPGVAIRLWEEAANAAMPAHDPPEIVEADLAPLLLASRLWGARDPTDLPLPTTPPAPALAEARRLLERLGALDPAGALTPHGRRIAALPLEPRLAHMLLRSATEGFGATAAAVALLLGERGLGGRGEDMEARLRRFLADRSPRARQARALAAGWARRVGADEPIRPDHAARALALAFPDRVARARDGEGARWASVGGRGFSLDPASPLASADWLAVAEVAGAAAGARILSAAPLEEEEVRALFEADIEPFEEVRYDPARKAVDASRGERLGRLVLKRGQAADPDPDAVARALLEAVAREGLELLPWGQATARLRRRAAYARQRDPSLPDLSEEALLACLDDWLLPLLHGRRRLDALQPGELHDALANRIDYAAMQAIDRIAPARFTSPAGTSHEIDYDAPAGPTVTVRAQALYGLDRHPTVGTTPLVLSLTSPAGRPIQTTTDLPAFWDGSWAEVAKEMRGRYPKHHWPDDPRRAVASLRTKRAQRGS